MLGLNLFFWVFGFILVIAGVIAFISVYFLLLHFGFRLADRVAPYFENVWDAVMRFLTGW